MAGGILQASTLTDGHQTHDHVKVVAHLVTLNAIDHQAAAACPFLGKLLFIIHSVMHDRGLIFFRLGNS